MIIRHINYFNKYFRHSKEPFEDAWPGTFDIWLLFPDKTLYLSI